MEDPRLTGTASHTTPVRPRSTWPASTGAPAAGETAVFGMLASLLGTCLAALGLALAGIFQWWAVPPLAVVCTVGLWRLRPRALVAARSPVTGRLGGRAPLAAVVAVAAVVTAVNLLLPSELLLSGRDGGTYTNTAAWLAHDGDLVIDARTGPYAEADDLQYRVAGFQRVRGEGDLYPQFIHTFPALMATAAGAAGLEAMLWVNPLLGAVALLTLYAFATRVVHPWTAVLVTVALAVNLVFTYYTRAPFTEVLALAFTFGGLWALDVARVRGDRRTALMAGLLLGGTTLARLDGLVVTLLVLGLAALGVAGRRHRGSVGGVHWPAVAVGALTTAGIAIFDMAVYSPFYLTMHTSYLVPLAAAAVLLPAGAVAAAGTPGARVWSWARAHRRQLATAAAAAIVLGAAYAALLRPVLGYATWERTTPIGYLQELAGQPVDEHRTYGEQTMRWLLWYLGPAAVVAGVAGWAGLVARSVRGRAPAAAPFLVLFTGMTVLYLWRPSITPDHIWAMRRFLTVSIPGLLLLAGWAVEWLARRRRSASRGGRVATGLAGVVLAVAVVAGGAAVTVPVAGVNELDGIAAGWDRVCDRLGDDAAVLVLQGDFTPWATTQGFRSYCDVPAANGAPTPARTAELARSWAVDGRQLVIVGSDANAVERTAGSSSAALVDVGYHRLEPTLMRAPSRLLSDRWELYAAEATP
jgi:hypothetical protein